MGRKVKRWTVLGAGLEMLLAGVAVCLSAVMAQADSTSFYKMSHGKWMVTGSTRPPEDRINNDCVASRFYDDGSIALIAKDLSDGELFVHLVNMNWGAPATAQKKSYNVRLTARDKKGALLSSGELTGGYMINKNEFRVRNIDEKTFIKAIMDSDSLAVIPSLDIENFVMKFDGQAKQIIMSMAACVKEYSKEREIPNFDIQVKSKPKGETF